MDEVVWVHAKEKLRPHPEFSADEQKRIFENLRLRTGLSFLSPAATERRTGNYGNFMFIYFLKSYARAFPLRIQAAITSACHEGSVAPQFRFIYVGLL